MSELQKSQHDVETQEPEVIEATPDDSSGQNSVTNNVLNQQNNFHLTQNYDIDKIANLSDKNPELADRLMCLYENQQSHNMSIDKRIIAIEEKEQKARSTERPFQRKFAFRALNFAMGLSILSLACAGFFAYLGYPILAGISISIPIGVAVANMLGFKAAGQGNNKKSENKEVTETDDKE